MRLSDCGAEQTNAGARILGPRSRKSPENANMGIFRPYQHFRPHPGKNGLPIRPIRPDLGWMNT